LKRRIETKASSRYPGSHEVEVDLKDVLNAAGPTATLLFASWIFLGYLNSRLSDSQKRFNDHDARHKSIYDQIKQNRKRCDLLFLATNDALRGAYFMFATIATGIISIATQQPPWLCIFNLCCALSGLVFLVLSVGKALAENKLLHQSITSEVADVPEFADKSN
jgi:hypothetical protein